jgi:hypothetical protein
MTTPGTLIVSRAAAPTPGGTVPTGTWHIAALAERGPTDVARLLKNLTDFDKHFGARVAYGVRDSVETYFRNGGVAVNMIRVVGPAAAKATVALEGAAAADSLEADSVGEGTSDYSVLVAVTADARFTLAIYEDTTLLETSPPFTLPTEAVTWAATNAYIRLRAVGSVAPAAATAKDLAGGDDDRANITDVHRIAALNLIPAGAGAGQVSIPGSTTTAAHTGVVKHAAVTNRFALIDSADSSVAADLVNASTAVKATLTDQEMSYAFLVEGWNVISGATVGTTRIVPPSAVVAALMAAHDAATGNPNEPAAGVNGIPSFSLGLNRVNWSDTERGTLNLAGVNVFREVGGTQRLYGYRTMVSPNGSTAGWLSAASARLRMALEADAAEKAEPFVFTQITKAKIAEYQGVLTGMLLGYYNLGALFGDTPAEAFVVDTGSTVNTPESLAERKLSAVIGVRMTEFAEIVYMEFVKIPTTEEL